MTFVGDTAPLRLHHLNGEVVQPTFSSDVATCDFFLFPKFKGHSSNIFTNIMSFENFAQDNT